MLLFVASPFHDISPLATPFMAMLEDFLRWWRHTHPSLLLCIMTHSDQQQHQIARPIGEGERELCHRLRLGET